VSVLSDRADLGFSYIAAWNDTSYRKKKLGSYIYIKGYHFFYI